MNICVLPRVGYTHRQEVQSSVHSGIRTRQLCGFFTPAPNQWPGGRRIQDPKGKEVHRLCAALNLLAAKWNWVKATPLGNSNSHRSRAW